MTYKIPLKFIACKVNGFSKIFQRYNHIKIIFFTNIFNFCNFDQFFYDLLAPNFWHISPIASVIGIYNE